jgi:hypothetical protein
VGDRFSDIFGVSFFTKFVQRQSNAHSGCFQSKLCHLWISLNDNCVKFAGKQFCESNTLPNIQQIPETPEHTQQIGLSYVQFVHICSNCTSLIKVQVSTSNLGKMAVSVSSRVSIMARSSGSKGMDWVCE